MIFTFASVKSEQLDEDLREIHINAKDAHLGKHLKDIVLASLVFCVVQNRREQDYDRGEQEECQYEVLLPPPYPLLEWVLLLALGLHPYPHLLRLDHEVVEHEPFHPWEQGWDHVRNLLQQFVLVFVIFRCEVQDGVGDASGDEEDDENPKDDAQTEENFAADQNEDHQESKEEEAHIEQTWEHEQLLHNV